MGVASSPGRTGRAHGVDLARPFIILRTGTFQLTGHKPHAAMQCIALSPTAFLFVRQLLSSEDSGRSAREELQTATPCCVSPARINNEMAADGCFYSLPNPPAIPLFSFTRGWHIAPSLSALPKTFSPMSHMGAEESASRFIKLDRTEKNCS